MINLSTKSIYISLVWVCAILGACQVKLAKEENSKVTIPTDMVYIPEGRFQMGGKSNQASLDEFPRHEVHVSSFLMDKTEITNRQFKEFIDATDYITIAERSIVWEEIKLNLPEGTRKPADSVLLPGSLVFRATEGPVDLTDFSQWWVWTIGANWKEPEGPGSHISDRMDHPVVHISHDDALAYANWAEKRLPTEAEWEWAAMGGLENTKYPWGDETVERAFSKANFWQGFFPYQNLEQDGYVSTAPVESYPPNGYGLYDMAGNVWEWCSDKYNVDTYAADNRRGVVKNPVGPKDSYDPYEPFAEKYTIRGGSFLCNDDYCSGYRVSRRMSSSRDSGFNHTGFRCVKDIN